MSYLSAHLYDFIAFLFFFSATVIYHVFYIRTVKNLPTHIFKGKINIIRRSWVENMLRNGNAITAVQSLRNINMAASFLASSSIVFVGGILYMVISIERTSAIFTGAQTITPQDYLLFFKFLCLIIMFLTSLVNFSLCIRLLNYLAILVGSSTQVIEETVGESAVDYITRLFSRAGSHYTFGMRGFYYSIPLIFWFLSTTLFLVVTLLILILTLRLDFGK